MSVRLFLLALLVAPLSGCAAYSLRSSEICKLHSREIVEAAGSNGVSAITVLDGKITFVEFTGGAIGCTTALDKAEVMELVKGTNIRIVIEHSDVQL